MNAIMENQFTKALNKKGATLNPSAILVVSAHWYTDGVTMAQSSKENKVIYDFGGFPEELYRVEYPTKGSVELSQKIASKVDGVELTSDWGLDHGAWAVLKHLFPKIDIPVFQLSIDYRKTMDQHYEIAKKLSFLNDEGVMILASGNVCHNLRLVDFRNQGFEPTTSWAKELTESVNEAILKNDIDSLLNYRNFPGAGYGIASNDHYIPLIYALGASHKKVNKEWFYSAYELGTLSMDCIEFS